MKIKTPPAPLCCSFDQLNLGDVFLHEGNYYLRVTSYKEFEALAVRVDSGIFETFVDSMLVYPVDAVLHIGETEYKETRLS